MNVLNKGRFNLIFAPQIKGRTLLKMERIYLITLPQRLYMEGVDASLSFICHTLNPSSIYPARNTVGD
jgi:hypothetical protein